MTDKRTKLSITKDQRNILIADDEEALRKVLGSELINEGYRVTDVGNGADAITFLKKKQFDIAILDINMPEMDGFSVLKYIKQHFPDTKAIMLTGYNDLRHAIESKKYGADDFVGKPYDLNDLLSSIERLLRS